MYIIRFQSKGTFYVCCACSLHQVAQDGWQFVDLTPGKGYRLRALLYGNGGLLIAMGANMHAMH